MDCLLDEVLKQYDIKNPKIEFIRHNENMTYQCTDNEKVYLIRIHKPIDGFSLHLLQNNSSPIDYIESEMMLLTYARENTDIPLQKPIKNKKGLLVSTLSDKTPATVLEWVTGRTLCEIPITEEIGESIGMMIAKLHRCFANIDSTHFNVKRYHYDKHLLIHIEEQLLEAFNKNQIKKEQNSIMKETLDVIKNRMDELDKIKGMSGIIHADLSPSNLILANQIIVPIDFSLSGYGYYYMDIAGIMTQFNDFNIRESIKKGYEKVTEQEISLRYIEPFFALCVLLYIACQHDKASKEEWFCGAMERWCNTIFIPLNNNQKFVL